MIEQPSILVTTLVSARDQSGRVQIEGERVKLQLSVEEARALASNILEAATYAEADAFLFHFMRETIDAGDAGAAQVLVEFRQYREARVARPPEGVPLIGPDGPLPPVGEVRS